MSKIRVVVGIRKGAILKAKGEKIMLNLGKVVSVVLAVVFLSPMAFSGHSQNPAKSGGPEAAILKADPLSLPLLTAIPPEQQIQLALSAAPPEISRHATVYVLESKGYVKARTGTNGFTCLVEREYPEEIAPLCYDAEGSATTLLVGLYREELRVAGISQAEIKRRIDAGYKAGKFKVPRKPGLAYMLSTQNKVYDLSQEKLIAAPPHLMFYAPYAKAEDLGGFIGVHMPFILSEGRPDAYIIVVPSWLSQALKQETPPAADHSH